MERIFLAFIVIFFGIYFSSNYSYGDSEIVRRKYIKLITIVLILFSGLRKWDVGLNSDTQQYSYIFDSVQNTSWTEIINNFIYFLDRDPFYTFFQKIFQLLSDNYQLYLIFIATLFFISIAKFVLDNTSKIKHILLAYIIYIGYFYGFYSLTGIRQTLATAVLLWAFKYVKERKIVPFLILNIVAGLFHLTALVFLPIYFIADLKNNKTIIGISLIGFPLFYYFKNSIAIFFVSITGVQERFGVYTSQYEKGGSLILTFLFILLGVLSILVIKRTLKINFQTTRFYNMYAMALFFYPLQWLNPSASRISQYFSIIIMVWIPYLIEAIAGNSKKSIDLLYLVTTMLFVFLTTFTIGKGNPYHFFWQ